MEPFSLELPVFVADIIKGLEKRGHKAYAVGGCIRDCLMGKEPKDWDIATSAAPSEVKAALPGMRAYGVGEKHGTVALLAGGGGVDVSTFRLDGPYLDGRRPSSVSFLQDINEDLARRDFTMNAIAFSPREGLIDPFGGAKDIRSRVIRSVGDPAERFSEDALRIMRSLRFASTLSFSLDGALEARLHKDKGLLRQVSSERLSSELLALLCGEGAFSVLRNYPDVLAAFIPEIGPCIGFEQNSVYHLYDVWLHTAYAISYAKREPLARLCLLFHDLGKPEKYFVGDDGHGHFRGHPQVSSEIAERRMRALRFPARDIEIVRDVVFYHDAPISGKSAIRWLSILGEAKMRLLLDVRRADGMAHANSFGSDRAMESAQMEEELDRVLSEGLCFRLKDLHAKGQDIMALGVSEGPDVGACLAFLLDSVIIGQAPNEKGALLKLAEGWISQNKRSQSHNWP
jgi:tRNA nucleotidyltransferase (CCA-adding enzyme)